MIFLKRLKTIITAEYLNIPLSKTDEVEMKKDKYRKYMLKYKKIRSNKILMDKETIKMGLSHDEKRKRV